MDILLQRFIGLLFPLNHQPRWRQNQNCHWSASGEYFRPVFSLLWHCHRLPLLLKADLQEKEVHVDKRHQGNSIYELSSCIYTQTHPRLLYTAHAPGTWLIPQSITIAPGLIHSPFTISALPAATTRISALPTYKKNLKTTNNCVSHWQWENAELLLQQVRSTSAAVKLHSPIATGGMQGHCQQLKVAARSLARINSCS